MDDIKNTESRKVFLSHKWADKAFVLDFKQTLQLLGFDPWIDDDAMVAGEILDRGILQGMKNSCGVVFFITSSFRDEGYLGDEINYAIKQKREKKDRFSLIVLLLKGEDGNTGALPDLLEPYVYKTPETDLEALREIVRALPVRVGPTEWRENMLDAPYVPIVEPAASPLSQEAIDILKAAASKAAASGNGRIEYVKSRAGNTILAGETQVIAHERDPRILALYDGGIIDLCDLGYIQDLGSDRETFKVTREGYQLADELQVGPQFPRTPSRLPVSLESPQASASPPVAPGQEDQNGMELNLPSA